MRHRLTALTRGAAVLACLSAAACVPPPAPTPAPAPTPTPVAPTPTPVATPSPVPTFSNWMDYPATPGDWSYQSGTARFGPPQAAALLVMRCDSAAGAVEIARSGAASAQMVIRAEAMERGVAATPAASELPATVARIPARDPLLDAMAFSKGRFAVEVAGQPTLYIPSYPEVTRVIEDCR